MFKKIRKCFVCLLLLSMISACSVNDENPYKEDVRNSLNNYIESYIDNKQYENDIANVEKEAEKVWNGITDAVPSDNDEDDILKVDFLDRETALGYHTITIIFLLTAEIIAKALLFRIIWKNRVWKKLTI